MISKAKQARMRREMRRAASAAIALEWAVSPTRAAASAAEWRRQAHGEADPVVRPVTVETVRHDLGPEVAYAWASVRQAVKQFHEAVRMSDEGEV